MNQPHKEQGEEQESHTFSLQSQEDKVNRVKILHCVMMQVAEGQLQKIP